MKQLIILLLTILLFSSCSKEDIEIQKSLYISDIQATVQRDGSSTIDTFSFEGVKGDTTNYRKDDRGDIVAWEITFELSNNSYISVWERDGVYDRLLITINGKQFYSLEEGHFTGDHQLFPYIAQEEISHFPAISGIEICWHWLTLNDFTISNHERIN